MSVKQQPFKSAEDSATALMLLEVEATEEQIAAVLLGLAIARTHE